MIPSLLPRGARLAYSNLRTLLLTPLFALAVTTGASAEARDLKVVVTIKPVHALAAGVMKGAGKPELLIKGRGNPHGFQLLPSQASALSKADLIVRIGPALEASLSNALENLGGDKKVLDLMELPAVKLHDMRRVEVFHASDEKDEHAGHDHDDHKHEKAEKHGKEHDHGENHKHEDDHDHDDHDHDKHEHEKDHEKGKSHDDHDHDHKDSKSHADEHDHKKEAKDEGHHHHHHHHAVDGEAVVDPHIWLSVNNASVMVEALAARFAELDPDRRALYEANAKKMKEQLANLGEEVSGKLSQLTGGRYVVFHDAYQYLTRPFGMVLAGAITIDPNVPPSAGHVRDLRRLLKTGAVKCIFAEPQFNNKIVRTITEGTKTKLAQLDPLGADLPEGEGSYEAVIQNLTNEIYGCLK